MKARPRVSSCVLFPALPHEGDQRDDGDDRERGQTAVADPALERLPAIGEEISDGCNRARPRDRAARVVEEKFAPRQSAAAREKRAEDPQSGHEARDDNRLRAMTLEVAIEMAKAGVAQ